MLVPEMYFNSFRIIAKSVETTPQKNHWFWCLIRFKISDFFL